MSQENVETVQRAVEAWNADDLDTFLAQLDADVEWHPAIEPGLEGKATTYRGHGGAQEIWRQDRGEAWARLTNRPHEFRDLGDSVLALGHIDLTARVTGIEFRQEVGEVFDLRAGKIVRIRDFLTHAEALEAVGLEQGAHADSQRMGLREIGRPMSQDNVEIARAIYAPWERGDFTGAHWAHPDIEFAIVDGLEAGTWTGLAGMAQAWSEWLGAWDEYRVEVDEYRKLDDERILVLMVHCGRGKTSGLEVAQFGTKRAGANVLHVRDGRVTRIVLYWDRDRALADLGLSE